MFTFKDNAVATIYNWDKKAFSFYITHIPEFPSTNGITHVLTNKPFETIKFDDIKNDLFITSPGAYHLNGNVKGENIIFSFVDTEGDITNITDHNTLQNLNTITGNTCFFYRSDHYINKKYTVNLSITSYTFEDVQPSISFLYSYSIGENDAKEFSGNYAIGPNIVTDFNDINYWANSLSKSLVKNISTPIIWIIPFVVIAINVVIFIFAKRSNDAYHSSTCSFAISNIQLFFCFSL